MNHSLTVSHAKIETFSRALLTAKSFDRIADLLDEQIQRDSYFDSHPSRRHDRELNRVLSILDGLDGRRE